MVNRQQEKRSNGAKHAKKIQKSTVRRGVCSCRAIDHCVSYLDGPVVQSHFSIKQTHFRQKMKGKAAIILWKEAWKKRRLETSVT